MIGLLRRSALPRSAIFVLLFVLACGGSVEDGSSDAIPQLRERVRQGDFAAVQRGAEEILARDPDDPQANLFLGLALMQQRQLGRAVWPLEKASRAEGDAGLQAGILLASVLFQTEGFEEAVKAASAVLERDPDRVAARLVRAEARLRMSQPAKALEDLETVLAADPDVYQAQVLKTGALADLGRLAEAEQAVKRMHEMALEQAPAKAGATCIALPSFVRDYRTDIPEEARKARVEEELLGCMERHPDDSTVIGFALWFYDATGRKERGNEILREAIARDPARLEPRQRLAQRLLDDGRPEEATAILREAAERAGTVESWQLVAQVLQRQGKLEEALDAVRRARRAEGSEHARDYARFQEADLLIELGRLEASRELVGRVQTEAYRALLEGRHAEAAGDAEAALAAYERGVAHWPNNVGARLVAAGAAEKVGDRERAKAHYREAARLDGEGTDAGYRLARMLYEEGDFRQALYVGARQAKGRPNSPELALLAAHAYLALHEYAKAKELFDAVTQWEVYRARAVAGLAAVAREEKGPDAALEVIAAHGLDPSDPEHRPLLESVVRDLVDLRRFDDALERVARARAADPASPQPDVLRGTVLLEAGRVVEASEAFAAALARDPEHGPALSGRAAVAVKAGRAREAVALYDRAAAAGTPDPSATYRAAQVVLRRGDRAEAERRLEAVLDTQPGHGGAANDLAFLLVEAKRDLDRARDLARLAVRLQPEAATLDTLGLVHLARDEPEAARRAFERALQEDPDSGELRYRLAQALEASGRTEEAIASLREALAGGDFPQEEEARARLASLSAGPVSEEER